MKKQEAKTQPSLVEKNSEVVSSASEVRKTTSEVEITEWEGEEDEEERGTSRAYAPARTYCKTFIFAFTAFTGAGMWGMSGRCREGASGSILDENRDE